MKPLFYVLAGITALLSVYSLYQFWVNLDAYGSLSIGRLSGFASSDNTPAYIELRKLFSEKTALFRDKAEEYQSYNLWANLGVTILTALATLISTINATKDQDMPKRIVLIIAVLTFLTTVTNWGQSQLTTIKTGAEKNLHDVRELRAEFMLRYQAAKDDSSRAITVETYRDKLEDI